MNPASAKGAEPSRQTRVGEEGGVPGNCSFAGVRLAATTVVLSQTQVREAPRSTTHSGSPPMCFSVTRAGKPPAKPSSAGAPHHLHGPYNSSDRGAPALQRAAEFLACQIVHGKNTCSHASSFCLTGGTGTCGICSSRSCPLEVCSMTAGTWVCSRAAFIIHAAIPHPTCLCAFRLSVLYPSVFKKHITICQPCACSDLRHGHVCTGGPRGSRCRSCRRRGC